jgi:hypothetical protein
MSVNVMRSPAFIPRPSRIDFGMVVWPLLVSVESVLIVVSGFLTF